MSAAAGRLADGPFYRELDDWCADGRLRAAMQACLEAQRACIRREPAARDAVPPDHPDPASEASLRALLARGGDVRGLATDPDISTVHSFNARNLRHTWMDREVAARRRDLDAVVLAKLRATFPGERRLSALTSGHWWYPAGSSMGWHTNSDSPGWRLYLVHAEEPGRSGFRYLHPHTDEVVTSLDGEWCARLFLIPAEEPFWHAVFSATNRFSFGYLVRPRSWSADAAWHMRRLAQGVARMRRSA